MKKNSFILAAIIFVASSCSGVKVTTYVDKTADFTKYKTVSYLGWQGVGVGTIKEKPEKREKSLPKAVATVLKDFPIAPVK